MSCKCEHYDEDYCGVIVCSKDMKNERMNKRKIRYGESEDLLVVE